LTGSIFLKTVINGLHCISFLQLLVISPISHTTTLFGNLYLKISLFGTFILNFVIAVTEHEWEPLRQQEPSAFSSKTIKIFAMLVYINAFFLHIMQN